MSEVDELVKRMCKHIEEDIDSKPSNNHEIAEMTKALAELITANASSGSNVTYYLLDIQSANEYTAKMEWLKSINAVEFPRPVKYLYGFAESRDLYYISEDEVKEMPLDELKKCYESCKQHAHEIIEAQKELGCHLHRDAPIQINHDFENTQELQLNQF